jgi:3-oxoadipate enol-lactonase
LNSFNPISAAGAREMAFFESRGMKLHYEVVGSGPPILMLHGFTNHGMVWAQQIADLLDAGYRVVLPDLAGHGLSQAADRKTTVDELAQDMVNLLDHLAIDRTIVCGLSLGGMVAQYMAADHQTRISALVVANSCVDSTAPDVVAAIDSWIEMFEKPNGPLLRLQAVWPQMLNERYRASPAGDAFLESWKRINGKIPGSSFANVARGLQQFKSADRLNKIKVPCLVISGEFDRLFPPAVCQEIANLTSGATFAVIGGAGHLSSLDSPREFNDSVLRFLQGGNFCGLAHHSAQF